MVLFFLSIFKRKHAKETHPHTGGCGWSNWLPPSSPTWLSRRARTSVGLSTELQSQRFFYTHRVWLSEPLERRVWNWKCCENSYKTSSWLRIPCWTTRRPTTRAAWLRREAGEGSSLWCGPAATIVWPPGLKHSSHSDVQSKSFGSQMTNTGGFLCSTYKSEVQVRRGRVSKGKRVEDCGQEQVKNHSEVMAQHRIFLWNVKSILKQQNQKTPIYWVSPSLSRLGKDLWKMKQFYSHLRLPLFQNYSTKPCSTWCFLTSG